MSSAMSAVAICLSWALAVEGYLPPSYPDYCNMNPETQRKIPNLTSSQLNKVSGLMQVQAIVRHGSRTPWGEFSCWKDYEVSWNNCNVTELLLASPSYTSDSRPANWLFRKLYDGSDNFLGGNCLTGQLLGEGYKQESTVGSLMYDAYMNNVYNLFPSSDWDQLDSDTSIYLRSDDEMRTLMSGMTLVHSFLNVSEAVIVPWHTGDYDLDQIYPNDEVCPRLDAVEDMAYATKEYQTENSSDYVNGMTESLNHIFGEGYWDWYHAMDCMMTAVCTGRPIPDGSGDYVMTDKLFNDTIAQSEYNYAYMATWNNSLYSRLAMGNTAWHVRNNLLSALNTSNPKPLKFALFSAHDTTVMPFLAAVTGDDWDQRWAGYAALITMEVYQRSSSYASQTGSNSALFRMVYNGLPLLLDGCDDTLCDIQVLLDALDFGKESMPCSVSSDSSSTNGGGNGGGGGSDCVGDVSTAGWVVLLVFSTLIGAGIGAKVMVVIHARNMAHQDSDLRPLKASTRDAAAVSMNPVVTGTSSSTSTAASSNYQA